MTKRKKFVASLLLYKLLNRKNIFFVIVSIICAIVIVPAYVHGADGNILDGTTFVNAIIRGISWIMLSIGQIAIGLAVFFLKFFINLASYNGFIDAPVVIVGWSMVRDIANMFFIVVFLVMAFATILGIESYEWKKILVKLILVAIFINFSNLIAQLVIDVAHVFTMTFLNAVSAAAGGNLINMFKLQEIQQIVGDPGTITGADDFQLSIFGGAFSAMMFALLAAISIGSYAIIMAFRVVVLWILIILSPLAFILYVLPATQSKATEWWTQFTKNVIAAPIMVFFLWLAFATLGNGDVIRQIEEHATEKLVVSEASANPAGQTPGAERPKLSLSEVTTWENMGSFFVAMAFLWVGIQKVQELGVVGSGMLASGVDFAKKVATIATGYAAGRYLVGKTKDVSLKVAKGAAWYAPLVGGEKWVMRGKLIGEGVKGWYHDKGIALTRKGHELQGQAGKKNEDLMALKARINKEKKAGKTTEQLKPLTDEAELLKNDIEGLEEAMSKESAGGIVGWSARSGIKLEKQVSKTEKQAKNRRELLWKRIGSESGSILFKTELFGLLGKEKDADGNETGKNRSFEIGIGMGAKGIGIGKFRLLGDRFRNDEKLALEVYGRGGITAMDRVERGWFQAEEARSKAKDEEIEGLGKYQGLSRPRLKYDVNTGTLVYQSGKGSLADQIALHKLGADIHHGAEELLTQNARLNVVSGGAKAATGVHGDYHEYLLNHSLANFKKLEVTETESELVRRDDMEFRLQASKMYDDALKLEKQIAEMHSDNARDELEQIEELRENLRDSSLTDSAKQQIKNMIGILEKTIKKKDDNDQSFQDTKVSMREGIAKKFDASPAWRYASAKSKAWFAGELEKNSESELISRAKQMEVYDEYGLDTPISGFAEMQESFKRELKDMPFEMAVANQGKMIETLLRKRKEGTLSSEDEKVSRVLSMAFYEKLREQSWLDDNVYGLRPSPELKELFQKLLGKTWDPNRDVMDLDTLGNIHALYASGMDEEFVVQDEFVRQLIGLGLSKNENDELLLTGLTVEGIYDGLRTGKFLGYDADGNVIADYTEQLSLVMEQLVNDRGSDRLEEVNKQVFHNGSIGRESFNTSFMEKIQKYQPELELLGNQRDDALQGTHPENAGWYQGLKINGQQLYVPVSGRMAEDYVLGDMKKIPDKGKLLGYQFHAWADVVQGAFGGAGSGQGILRIRARAYASARSNITDGRIWERATGGRTKKVLGGLLANEEESDYIDNEGYRVIGDARNEKGKRWGLLENLTYLNEGGKYKNANGSVKSEDERRQAALDHLFNENFIHQLRYGGRDLLYTLATECGITTYDADSSGKIKLKIKVPDKKDEKGLVIEEGREILFDNINDLIKSLNGDLGDGKDLNYTRDNKLKPLEFSREREPQGQR